MFRLLPRDENFFDLFEQQAEHIVAFQCARVGVVPDTADDQFDTGEVMRQQRGQVFFIQTESGR